MEKGRICVTGGRGFIASWIIKRLLEDGYSVNTTVRSHSASGKDVSYITNLPGASERLQIFDADLSKPETFEAPIKGCNGVFHVAHPMSSGSEDSADALTEKTIKGSLGILKVCIDSKTVKKFVYTSSLAAVRGNTYKNNEVANEECWSDIDYIRTHLKSEAWYYMSKTLTERAILNFGEKEGLDVVTIPIPFVHGPFLGPQCPPFVRTVMGMIFGDTHLHPVLWKANFVHVDDVASAHIHLFEDPKAKGRYICSRIEVSIEELHKLLTNRYPEYKIPDLNLLKLGDADEMMLPSVSSEKLLGTGFKYKYGIEEMYDDAIECCKQNNIL